MIARVLLILFGLITTGAGSWLTSYATDQPATSEALVLALCGLALVPCGVGFVIIGAVWAARK